MGRALYPLLRDDAMTFSKAASEYIAHLSVARGYAQGTCDGYDRAYKQFGAYLRTQAATDDLRHFTDQQVLGFMNALGTGGMRPNSIIMKLSALSSLAGHLMKRKDARGRPLLPSNPTQTFDWPTHEETETRYLHGDEAARYLEAEVTRRESLIRDVTLDTGLRAAELCRLNVEDLIDVAGTPVLSITVKGRGRRRRKVNFPLSGRVAHELREWLLERGLPDATSPPPGAPLLLNSHGQRLTHSALTHVLSKIGRKAGIDRFTVTPHKLRHTINVVRRVAGLDPTQRSALLGHASPASLKRYDHIVPGELAEAKEREQAGLAQYVAPRRDLARAPARTEDADRTTPGEPRGRSQSA